MTPQEYYRLVGPTELAGPPDFYSPTSLAALRKCPLQWQLTRSKWGDLPRHPGTPNRKRIAGSIIHDLLEAMFRQLGRAGRPPRGSADFRAAMRLLNVRALLAELLEKAEQDWSSHPRTKGSPLALDAGDLRKRAFHTFRASYRPASGKPGAGGSSGGPLGAEVDIKDEELRLRGRIDLARREELVEFKTGEPRPDHERQLELYAVVWSRQRGVLPKLTLVYPGESRSWAPTTDRLTSVQSELEKEVAEFDGVLQERAKACSGDHCRYCPVRALCEVYWESPRSDDLEFHVTEAPNEYAIGDGTVLVGLHASHRAATGPIAVGAHVRLLGVQTKGNEVTLPPWGEVFVGSSMEPE